ncbi:MAG: hypothetical protein M1480_12975 [Bacteroidetes bacterium]|nr:hypothetical protein [Bacteroidota bacterium]
MATVNGSVLGNLSGKLGNLTARTVEGKTILAARPSNFTPSMDQNAVDIRSKFGITAGFAKYILTIGTLEIIWKFVKKAGMSVFNTVLLYNFPFTSAAMPTAQNVITPVGFNPPVSSVVIDANGLAASIAAVNTVAEITAGEVKLSAVAIVCFHNPNSQDVPAYRLVPVVKDIESFDFTSSYNLNISFTDYQKNIQSKYDKYIIYLALVTKDAAGNVVRYSSTYAKQSE